VIHQQEIIPSKYIPVTWNSNVVESWLWRIKGLAEYFVYFCDDMYVGKPVKPEVFFLDGKPINRMHQGPITFPLLKDLPPSSSFIPTVRMYASAQEKFGLYYTRFVHQAMPFRKSLIKKYYGLYRKQVCIASRNKIRSGETDFNLLRFSTSLTSMNGEAFVITTTEDYDYFVESDQVKDVRRILKIRPTFFCINNTNTSSSYVYDILAKYLGGFQKPMKTT
jgi:hypothetical protein